MPFKINKETDNAYACITHTSKDFAHFSQELYEYWYFLTVVGSLHLVKTCGNILARSFNFGFSGVIFRCFMNKPVKENSSNNHSISF